MEEFQFNTKYHQDEIEKVKRRNLKKERILLLLLGPSGVGKSTIIEELSSQNNPSGFEYVKPLITRRNRPGEVDKVSISDTEFDRMENSGKFVVVNRLYGVRYGTPLAGILEPLSRGMTPVLDYPLSTVAALERGEYDILSFYIYPPSMEVWRKRLELGQRTSEGRFEEGAKELGALATVGYLHQDVNFSLVNEEGAADAAASRIRESIEIIIAR